MIKRYNFRVVYLEEHELEDGGFVLYDDYANLQSERDALAAEVEGLRAALHVALEFANGFSITVTDSYYKDAYLGCDFPKSEVHPHGKSILYRLPTPSTMSPDLAHIEAMRVAVIDAARTTGGESQ